MTNCNAHSINFLLASIPYLIITIHYPLSTIKLISYSINNKMPKPHFVVAKPYLLCRFTIQTLIIRFLASLYTFIHTFLNTSIK